MEIEINTNLLNGQLTITADEISADIGHDDFFYEVLDCLSDQGFIYNGDLIKENKTSLINLYIVDPSGRAYSLIEYTNNSYFHAMTDLRAFGHVNLYMLDEESTTDIKREWF